MHNEHVEINNYIVNNIHYTKHDHSQILLYTSLVVYEVIFTLCILLSSVIKLDLCSALFPILFY